MLHIAAQNEAGVKYDMANKNPQSLDSGKGSVSGTSTVSYGASSSGLSVQSSMNSSHDPVKQSPQAATQNSGGVGSGTNVGATAWVPTHPMGGGGGGGGGSSSHFTVQTTSSLLGKQPAPVAPSQTPKTVSKPLPPSSTSSNGLSSGTSSSSSSSTDKKDKKDKKSSKEKPGAEMRRMDRIRVAEEKSEYLAQFDKECLIRVLMKVAHKDHSFGRCLRMQARKAALEERSSLAQDQVIKNFSAPSTTPSMIQPPTAHTSAIGDSTSVAAAPSKNEYQPFSSSSFLHSSAAGNSVC